MSHVLHVACGYAKIPTQEENLKLEFFFLVKKNSDKKSKPCVKDR